MNSINNKLIKILLFIIILTSFIQFTQAEEVIVNYNISPSFAMCQNNGGAWAGTNCDLYPYNGNRSCLLTDTGEEGTFCDDTAVETQTAQRDSPGGIEINSVDTSITNCENIKKVELVYKVWWDDTRPTRSFQVNANGDLTYNTITGATFDSTEPGSPRVVDVTSQDTWTCADFTTNDATPPKARVLWDVSSGSGSKTYTVTTDVLFYSVTYNYTLPPDPIITSNTGAYLQDTSASLDGQNWNPNANVKINITRQDTTIDQLGTFLVNGTGYINTTYDIGSYYAPGTYTVYALQTNDSANNATTTFTVNARTPTISIPRTYYSIGELLKITGSNFAKNNVSNITLIDPNKITTYINLTTANSSGGIKYNYTWSASLDQLTGDYIFNVSEIFDQSYNDNQLITFVMRPNATIDGTSTFSNINMSDAIYESTGGGGAVPIEVTFDKIIPAGFDINLTTLGIVYKTTGSPVSTVSWYNDTAGGYQSICTLPVSATSTTTYCSLTDEAKYLDDYKSLRIQFSRTGTGGEFLDLDFTFINRTYNIGLPTLEVYYPTPDLNLNPNEPINITYNISGELAMDSCTLYFDRQFNQTDTSITNNVNQSFNFTNGLNLVPGTHNLTVSCTETTPLSRTINSSEIKFSIYNYTIYSVSPINNSNILTENGTVELTWGIGNNPNTLSCTIMLNGDNYQSTSCDGNTETKFNLTELDPGKYNWSVNLTDPDGIPYTTELRYFNHMKEIHEKISKEIKSSGTANLYTNNITLEHLVNSTSKIIHVIDFVDTSFNPGSFSPSFDFSNETFSPYPGDIYVWNLTVPKLSSTKISYATLGISDYELLNNYMLALE